MNNVYVVMQALILIATLFSCIYGFKKIQEKKVKKYFMLALYGMISLLFARIFYLVSVLSKSNDSILTMDILGQGAAYLFFITANTKYLTRNFTSKLKEKVCYPSLLGLILIGLILFLTAYKVDSLPSYIREILYFIFMGNALYTAIGIICYAKEVPACKYVYSYNICVILLITLTSLLELTIAYIDINILIIPISILTTLIIIVMSLMLPLLDKETSVWKQ